jgi:Flp pilus assembly protein TadB
VRLDAALAATGNWIGVPHLAVTGLVAAAVVVLVTDRLIRFNSALSIVLALAAAIAAPILLLWLAQSRYQRHFLDAFPDALDLIGRAVRAGLPAVEAMEVAGREIRPPVGIEFQRVLEEVRLGVDIGEAPSTRRSASASRFPLLCRGAGIAAPHRGALAETLRNPQQHHSPAQRGVRLKARALSAGPKASAAVLAILPFVVGAPLHPQP